MGIDGCDDAVGVPGENECLLSGSAAYVQYGRPGRQGRYQLQGARGQSVASRTCAGQGGVYFPEVRWSFHGINLIW